MAQSILASALGQGPFEVGSFQLNTADATVNAPVAPASGALGGTCRNFWALIHEKTAQGTAAASVNSTYSLQVSSENTFAAPYTVDRRSVNDNTASPGSITLYGVLPHIASGWGYARVVYNGINGRLATYDSYIRAS